MGFCMLYRKKGQSIKVRDPDKQIYNIRFDGYNGDRLIFTIDGEYVQIPVKGEHYLDDREVVMIMPISYDGSLRLGIDAPSMWDIAREEIPFRN